MPAWTSRIRPQILVAIVALLSVALIGMWKLDAANAKDLALTCVGFIALLGQRILEAESEKD